MQIKSQRVEPSRASQKSTKIKEKDRQGETEDEREGRWRRLVLRLREQKTVGNEASVERLD